MAFGELHQQGGSGDLGVPRLKATPLFSRTVLYVHVCVGGVSCKDATAQVFLCEPTFEVEQSQQKAFFRLA